MATVRQPDALHQLEGALRDLLERFFPMTRQALRAATPQKETPAVAAAGASRVPTSQARSEAMQTVPQPRASAPQPQHHATAWPALTQALDQLGTARQRAIVAWHSHDGMSDLDAACAAHPHYPLIACSDQPAPFAPRRATPRPAA